MAGKLGSTSNTGSTAAADFWSCAAAFLSNAGPHRKPVSAIIPSDKPVKLSLLHIGIPPSNAPSWVHCHAPRIPQFCSLRQVIVG